MKNALTRIFSALLGLLAITSPPASAQVLQAYESYRELVPTMDAPDEARGTFVDRLYLAAGFSRHDVGIAVSGLEAGSYVLDVGNESYDFSIGADPETAVLETDVHINTVGALVTVRKDDLVLLRTLGNGPLDLETSGVDLMDKSKGKAKLLGATKAKGKAKLKTVNKVKPEKKYSAVFLVFDFKKLEAETEHRLFANDWPIARFFSDEKGKARIIFTNEPVRGDFILTFDPTEADYELVPDGASAPIMQGRMTGDALGGGLDRVNGLNWLMAVTGVDNDATGRLSVQGGSPDAITQLILTVEALAQGTYDVMLDDAVIGTLDTNADGDGQAIFANPGDIIDQLVRVVNDEGKVVLGRTLETY